MSAKIVAAILAALIVITIVLALAFPLWLLWSWALPQLWPTGPAALIAPGYWLFAGVLVLVKLTTK